MAIGRHPIYTISKGRYSKKSSSLINITIIGLCLLAIVIGAVLLAKPNIRTVPIPPQHVLLNSPSSRQIDRSQIDNYQVAPDLPRYILIPAINIDKTRVIQLGLTGHNQIAAPNNIYDAGWYSGSAKPGQAGAMFIYGHVSSWTANGVFYNLKKLHPGDKIIIQRGDGQTLTYQVKLLKTYPRNEVDMQAVLRPIDPDRQGLNLMTCTGKVIPSISEFSQRLVVFASLI